MTQNLAMTARNRATDTTKTQELAPKSRSLLGDARIRFFKNRAALVSLFILAGVTLFALFGNFFAQHDNESIWWAAMGNVETMGAPSLSNGHYFGLDPSARDLYARMVQATRISLMVALVSTVISTLIGLIVGMLAAWYGRYTDMLLMRFVDILLAIPYLIFFIVVMALFGRSLTNLLLVIGLTSWSTTALIARGQVLTLKNKEYVDAARMIGLSNFQILFRHILPNLAGIIIVYTTITVPEIIMFESLLSFLGMGVQEPSTSWGVLISEGVDGLLYKAQWQFFIPFGFFAATLLSLYYIGDGLRDAFDPKDR